jgi:hypothetical protein
MSLAYIGMSGKGKAAAVGSSPSTCLSFTTQQNADITENYFKFEFCMAVRFLQAKQVSRTKIHRGFVSVYGQNVFSQKKVSVWCNKLKDGRTALNDDPVKQRGRPKTLYIDENCVIV